MPHPQFSLHTFILEWLVREIFRHAYLSMELINFHLQFHFDLQRHLGTQFPLVSCCDLEKNMFASKKETTSAKQVIFANLSLFLSSYARRRKWAIHWNLESFQSVIMFHILTGRKATIPDVFFSICCANR